MKSIKPLITYTIGYKLIEFKSIPSMFFRTRPSRFGSLGGVLPLLLEFDLNCESFIGLKFTIESILVLRLTAIDPSLDLVFRFVIIFSIVVVFDLTFGSN